MAARPTTLARHYLRDHQDSDMRNDVVFQTHLTTHSSHSLCRHNAHPQYIYTLTQVASAKEKIYESHINGRKTGD
jgi:hypothetical protein